MLRSSHVAVACGKMYVYVGTCVHLRASTYECHQPLEANEIEPRSVGTPSDGLCEFPAFYFSTLYQKFAGVSPEIIRIHRNVTRCSPEFARMSNWRTLKGITTTRPSHTVAYIYIYIYIYMYIQLYIYIYIYIYYVYL